MNLTCITGNSPIGHVASYWQEDGCLVALIAQEEVDNFSKHLKIHEVKIIEDQNKINTLFSKNTLSLKFLWGTPFQQKVWQTLHILKVDKKLFTYSELAQAIGKPKAVRAVAQALGKNPILYVIPCHRVIGKNGTLTGFRCGIENKRKLLSLDGYQHEKFAS